MIGVFGILIGAVRQQIRSGEDVKKMIDALAGKHGCRISIALYQKVLETLNE